jgi:beta-mannosidase
MQIFSFYLILIFTTVFDTPSNAQTQSVFLKTGWHIRPTTPPKPPRKEDLGQNINPNGYDLQLPNSAMNVLVENKAVPDPFFKDNEAKLQWLERTDWIWENRFDVSKEVLKLEKNELILRGIDTYADIYLNDSLILKTDNAFLEWRVEVKKYLKTKENVLKILFSNPIGIEKKKNDDAPVDYPDVYNTKRMFTRKPQFHYGWDWGPRFLTCGLREVELLGWEGFKIEETLIKQTHLDKDSAILKVNMTINSTLETTADVAVTINGKSFNHSVLLKKGLNNIESEVKVTNPIFWWTHDRGTPFLYDLDVEVKYNKDGFYIGNNAQNTQNAQNTEGAFIAKKTQRIGLRTIELVTEKDVHGESFYFRLNGAPIFAKGVNYIPQHYFQELVTREDNLKTVENALAANMNMIRVWGGGIYETDDFYQACDEKGLLVWQDFMYACAMYPGDAAFLENAKLEAIEQVKRLNKHPSIALWCGNNEINEAWHNWGWQPRYNPDQKEIIWKAYTDVFNGILPEAVRQFSNQTNYWESSPRFGRYNNKSYTEGDNHDWFVWHDEKPFEHFEERVPRFMSEYGFQSFPDWQTIESFSDSTDWTLESKVMTQHQKHPKGNVLIKKYTEKSFKTPKTFKDFVYVSQLVQAQGIRMAVEAQRRAKPYCMGTLYWQLNDVWQSASWSSIDNFGRWKALHYAVRDAYAPVLVSMKTEKDRAKIHVVNDSLREIKGQLQVESFDFTGRMIFSDTKNITVRPDTSEEFYNVGFEQLLNKIEKKNNVYLKLSFLENGQKVSESIRYLVQPKDLNLKKGEVFKTVEKAENGFIFKLKSPTLLKSVYLSVNTEGVFHNNYFDLLPNVEYSILYKTKVDLDAVLLGFEVRSLVDSY